MTKVNDEDDDEEDIDWQSDVSVVNQDEDEEDEQIEWMDDVNDRCEETEDSCNRVKTHEGKEEMGVIFNMRRKRDDRDTNNKKKVTKNGVTRKRKLPFTQEDEIRARENHKALLEEIIHNLKKQRSLFFDDHLVALLQSMLPEHLMLRSHKVRNQRVYINKSVCL